MSGVLVGRDHEMAQLDELVGNVLAGAAANVALAGEPGIGKSRLLSELAELATSRRFLVLEGRAAEFEHDIPFGVIIDALNDYAGSLEQHLIRSLDGDVVGELASILPALGRFAEEAPAARTAATRYRVHYAIRALLERLARERPVLLVLDDLHWADEASLEVIAHVLRRFQGPLLTALAFRQAPKRLTAPLDLDAGDTRALHMKLSPLTDDEAAALLGAGVDPGSRDELYRESGGNPFYLEQLARARRSGGASARAQVEQHDEAGAPAAVIGAIEEELQRLSEPERLVLGAAAVAGESFDPWLVARIAELEETATLAALDALIAVDLMRPSSLPRNFGFRHPIVRRVVYETTPAGARILAHARAASALADARASEGEVAHHVALSARPGDEHAAARLTTAARAAAARAPLTAGRWLLAASALLPRGEAERRARLLDEAAAALTSAGAFADALTALDEALSLTNEAEHELIARLATDRAEARRRGGRPFESQEQLERAMHSLPPDSELVADVRLELAMNRYWHGDFERVKALAGPIREQDHSRETQQAGGLGRLAGCLACSLLSLVASYEERPRDADELLEDAQSCFEALGDETLSERIYLGHYIGEAALCRERAEQALGDVRRCFRVARRTGQEVTAYSWLGVEVHALLLKGQIRDAARVAAESSEAFTPDDEDDWRMTWMLAPDALAAVQAGDHERSLRAAGEMVTRSIRSHPATILPELGRAQLGGALLASGDPQGALRELAPLEHEASTWLLDLNGGYGWSALIHAKLKAGALADGEQTAAVAADRARRAALPQRDAAIRCGQTALALQRDDARSAAEVARDAIEIAAGADNPVVAARARTALGTALARLGDHSHAIHELEAGETVLLDCGAVREADAAARELRRLGRRVTRAGRAGHPPGLPALTPREREVAGEVAVGKSNREVAQTLFLSEKTVESHLARIFGKLDIHSRAALAAIVAREHRLTH